MAPLLVLLVKDNKYDELSSAAKSAQLLVLSSAPSRLQRCITYGLKVRKKNNELGAINSDDLQKDNQ